MAEGLSAFINGQQRCHWHATRDLFYTLWQDGAAKAERRTLQEDLALVLGIEIPEDDIEAVTATDRKELERYVDDAEKYIETMIGRMNGESRYTLRQMVNLLVGGVFGLSRKPLGLATVAAVVLAGLGFTGWLTSLFSGLVCWIFLLTAMELFGLGLVGAYLGRAYMEVLDRPMYIISKKLNFDETNTDNG
jgi:hypothetical protein